MSYIVIKLHKASKTQTATDGRNNRQMDQPTDKLTNQQMQGLTNRGTDRLTKRLIVACMRLKRGCP